MRVIPPVVEPVPARCAPTPDAGDAQRTSTATFDEPILLFVGQLLPHKRPDLLVKAMHIAATYLGLQARLLLVGQNRFARYADAVSAQIRELNLAQVHVVGSVDDARLAAMFRRAIAFVTVSEHEGFCVPLLEAMAFDVPVLARACAAIPETRRRRRAPAPGVGRRRAGRRGDRPHRRRRRPARATSSRAGRRRLRELTEIDASVAMLEAIGEVV